MTHVWPDGSEPQLRDGILAHAGRHPGTDLTNVGGWHSEPGTLEFCGTAGQRLTRHMDAMIEEATLRLYAEFARPPQRASWILSAWANVNRRSGARLEILFPSYVPHAVLPHRGDRPRISIAFNARREPFP